MHYLVILLLILDTIEVRYYDFEGKVQKGELICNKAITKDLKEIFGALYKAKYPIARVEPIERYGNDDERSMTANNTSCYCNRKISGSKRLSKHAQGLAVDINPLYNPCVNTRTGKVEPKAGTKYACNRDKRKDIPGKIDRSDLCYRLFVQHGFSWGGAWKTKKDYQHFEK